MRKILGVVAWTYAVFCFAALILIPIGIYGWFGVSRSPFSAVFALMLAMPWSLLLKMADGNGVLFATFVLAGGMAANLGILILLRRAFTR